MSILGEYDEAKECYKKALAVSKEVGNRREEAFAYRVLGGFLSRTERLSKG